MEKTSMKAKLGEELWEAIENYARSAVVLYGVVTIRELEELIYRYRPECKILSDDLVAALEEIAKKEDANFFLMGHQICHFEFQCGADTMDVVDTFLEDRAGKPRWYPEDEQELFEYNDDGICLAFEEAVAFAEFAERHGLPNENERLKFLFDLVFMHQQSVPTTKMIAKATGSLKLVTEADQKKFNTLFMAFLNTMPLRVNNGWSAEELFEKDSASAAEAKKEIGRNDPCPCGSGKKYKKCCGRDL